MADRVKSSPAVAEQKAIGTRHLHITGLYGVIVALIGALAVIFSNHLMAPAIAPLSDAKAVEALRPIGEPTPQLPPVAKSLALSGNQPIELTKIESAFENGHAHGKGKVFQQSRFRITFKNPTADYICLNCKFVVGRARKQYLDRTERLESDATELKGDDIQVLIDGQPSGDENLRGIYDFTACPLVEAESTREFVARLTSKSVETGAVLLLDGYFQFDYYGGVVLSEPVHAVLGKQEPLNIPEFMPTEQ